MSWKDIKTAPKDRTVVLVRGGETDGGGPSFYKYEYARKVIWGLYNCLEWFSEDGATVHRPTEWFEDEDAN